MKWEKRRVTAHHEICHCLQKEHWEQCCENFWHICTMGIFTPWQTLWSNNNGWWCLQNFLVKAYVVMVTGPCKNMFIYCAYLYVYMHVCTYVTILIYIFICIYSCLDMCEYIDIHIFTGWSKSGISWFQWKF